MRIVALTASTDFTRTLRGCCEPAAIAVTELKQLDSGAGALAHAADALIVHRPRIDATAVALVAQAIARGFRDVFVIAAEPAAPEWEERAYDAGATMVAAEPLRAPLLLAQLRRAARTRLQPAAFVPPQLAAAAPAAPPAPRHAELDPLRIAARLLRHERSPDAVAEAFLRQLGETLGITRLALYLNAPGAPGGGFGCVYAAGANADAFKRLPLSLETGVGAFLRQHGVVLVAGGPLAMDAQVAAELHMLGAQAAVPITDGAALVGVLFLGYRITGEPLQRSEIEAVFHLMADLGLVLRGRTALASGTERTLTGTVLEQAGIGVLVIDDQLRVAQSNSRFAEALGQDPHASLRFEHLPEELAAAVYDTINGTSTEPRIVTLRAPSSRAYRAAVESGERSAAGRGTVLVVTQECTHFDAERTHAARAARDELLGLMGTQFAHVVRNALMHVSTLAQLLPTKHTDPEFVGELCARLPAELHRLLHAADQLEWLKRDVGHAIPVDITASVQAAWAKATRFHDVTRLCQLKVNLVQAYVLCDPTALDAMLFELLANAVQATSAEGTVEVTEDEPNAETFTLHVHDDGAGFAEEARARAAEPFFTTKNTGVGLGLTVVERLIALQGGRLTLGRSSRRRGADVALSFRLHSP